MKIFGIGIDIIDNKRIRLLINTFQEKETIESTGGGEERKKRWNL